MGLPKFDANGYLVTPTLYDLRVAVHETYRKTMGTDRVPDCFEALPEKVQECNYAQAELIQQLMEQAHTVGKLNL